jgi:hypothetical protein
MIRLVRAELTKLTTTRLLYGLTAAMAAFAALTVVANVIIAGEQGDPLSAYSLPVLVAGPVTLLSGAALLLGILGMAGEFRHQTVTQTFLVTPHRGRVVAAKLVAYPLAGIALTLTILAFTAAVATGWLAAKGITPSLVGAIGVALGHVLLGGRGRPHQPGRRPPLPAGRHPAAGRLRARVGGRWDPAGRPPRHHLISVSGRRPLARQERRPDTTSKEDEHHGIDQDLESGHRRTPGSALGHHRHPGRRRREGLRPSGPLLQAGRRLPDQDLR